MPELISMLVSFFTLFSTAEPPREALLHFVLNHLFKPDQPDINTQSYLDQMGPFVFIATGALLIEVFYRLFKLIRGESAGYHGRQFGISAGFLTVLAASMPAMLLGSQIAVTDLCKWIALSLTGSENPEALYQALVPLTGNGIVDLGLGAVQIVFLWLFAIAITLIPLFLAISLPLMLVGVGWRWWGDIGAHLFRLGMSVTIYAVSASGIYLLILALCHAIGKTWTRDAFGQGLFNTGVLVFTAIATFRLMSLLKDRLKAVVSGAVTALSKTKGAINSGVEHFRSARDQMRDTISARTRRSESGTAAAAAGKFKPAAATTTATTTEKEQVTAMEQEKSFKSQLSATASRSRHRLTAPQQPVNRAAGAVKLGKTTAAAIVTKSPAAALAAAQAAKEMAPARRPRPAEPPSPSVTPAPTKVQPLPVKPAVAPTPIQAARRGAPRPRPAVESSEPRRRR